MRARITEKREIAEGTLFVRFDLSAQEANFKAGQFFFVRLIDPPYSDERANRRHFSIVNSPVEKNVLAMATRMGVSAFKRSLQELPLSTEVEVGPIGGDFVLPENPTKPLVFMAGGIGITPFMSMLRYVREIPTVYKVTLIYSNRNKASAAFYDEIEQIASRYPNIKFIPTMTSDPAWTGEKRRIDTELLKEYFPEPGFCDYYIAGPHRMVSAISDILPEVGINQSQIHTEKFSGY